MVQPTLAILIGIQGSGKSTFFRTHLANQFVHISLDILKNRRRESLALQDSFSQHLSIAIDNTNPTRADRQRYISLAKENGYQVIGYFMESKLQACIARNNLRLGKEKIPAKAIAATSNRLELPSYDEGFDKLFFVSNDGDNMTISEWRDPQ